MSDIRDIFVQDFEAQKAAAKLALDKARAIVIAGNQRKNPDPLLMDATDTLMAVADLLAKNLQNTAGAMLEFVSNLKRSKTEIEARHRLPAHGENEND